MEGRLTTGESSCTGSESGVVVVGEHDITTATEFTAALQAAAKLSGDPLSIDLSRATFIDSSIAAALVRFARELVPGGRSVVLRVAEGSTPASVVEIVGLAAQPGIVVETTRFADQ